jgi:hypothetical protein
MTETTDNMPDGVCNPVRNVERHSVLLLRCSSKTLRTGLQTPSSTENVTDGVANPVQHRWSGADFPETTE